MESSVHSRNDLLPGEVTDRVPEDDGFVFNGVTYRLDNFPDWPRDAQLAFSDQMSNPDAPVDVGLSDLSLNVLQPSAATTEGMSVDAMVSVLIYRAGYTEEQTRQIVSLLGLDEAQKSLPKLVAALRSLQHIPSTYRLQPVRESLERYATVPTYDVGIGLQAKAGVLSKIELPSRMFRIACERWSTHEWVVNYNSSEHCLEMRKIDGTILYFYPLEQEKDSNVARNSQILSQSGQPIEFVKLSIEKMARHFLYLQPCTVTNGSLVPLTGDAYKRYLNSMIMVTYQQEGNPNQLAPAHRAFVHAILKKIATAKPHAGLDRRALIHLCLILYETGIAKGDIDLYAASYDVAEIHTLFRLPVILGDLPENLIVSKGKHSAETLAECNPISVLMSLATARMKRSNGNAPGADDLATPSSMILDVEEPQLATAYKVARPIIDLGAHDYFRENPQSRLAFIGVRKFPEVEYFSDVRGQIDAFDLDPHHAHGIPINYLDVLKQSESLRALSGKEGLFFDVAGNNTGTNISSANVEKECSYTKNQPLFVGCANLVHGVRPRFFTIKTFLPPFDVRQGPIWSPFDILYEDYDLQFFKTGKLHTDEYILGGVRRAKKRTPEEMEKGRVFFFTEWRRIGAIVRAGNEVNFYCLGTGRTRLVFSDKEHPLRLGKGAVGGRGVKMRSCLRGGIPVDVQQVNPMKELEKVLSQFYIWHQEKGLKIPHVIVGAVTEHYEDAHAAQVSAPLNI